MPSAEENDRGARVLLAVDESVSLDEVFAVARCGHAVDLFSLAGDWLFIQRLEHELHNRGVVVRLLPSARLIDREMTDLRAILPAWSDTIAAEKIDGRTIQEVLRLPGMETSPFWFGSIVERNPFKTRELLLVAIARAVDRQLRDVEYVSLAIGAASPLAVGTLAGVGRAQRVAVQHLLVRRTAGQRWEALSGGRAGTLLHAAAILARQAIWSVLSRGLTLGPAPADAGKRPVLFVTYFPYIDRAAAGEDRFVNRFAAPLQEALAREDRPIWWAGLFVFIDGWSFRDAVDLVRRFRKRGERLALLDAYFTPAAWWRVARQAVRIRRAAVRAEGHAIRAAADLVPEGAEGLVRRIWRRSYEGADLVRGLYYLEVFRGLLEDTRAADTVVYFAEFQTWEQTLNAVRAARRPALRAVAFQHTAVSSNYYFYFRTAQEVSGGPDVAPMPLPSIMAASGARPAELLAGSGLTVEVVEAIRQMHVADVIRKPPVALDGDRPTLLIAGSIDRRETRAMLALVAAAYPRTDAMRVWIKAHPSMPAEPLLDELGVNAGAAGYEIVGGAVGDWLARSAFVLVGSSAVAIEALAHGCEVLVPVFASSPCLTPLSGFEGLYRAVYSPGDLRAAVTETRANGPVRTAAEKREFVRTYWLVDPTLERWRSLLGLPSYARRNMHV